MITAHGDVQARVESSWDRDSVKVWVWRKDISGPTLVYSWVEHLWQPLEDGAILPDWGYLLLPHAVAAAIFAAGADHQPPNTSQARHLDDAIAVRDRLLLLIEAG